jgi:hypothetical protein
MSAFVVVTEKVQPMKHTGVALEAIAWLCRLAVLLVVGGLVACSDDASDSQKSPSSPPTVASIIGSDGGTVQAEGVTIEVPPGALDEPTELRITRLEDAAPSGYRLASAMYRFEPEGLTFKMPVGVAIQFDGPAADLQLFWSDTSGGFAAVPSTPRGQIMHGETLHFSVGFVGQVLENVVAVSKIIGAAGGTLTLDGVTLTIPRDALAGDTTIAIRKTSETPPSGVTPSSAIYEFEPLGLGFGPESPRPTVSMNVGAVTGDMALYWRNTAGDFWALASRADGQTVSADITSFSAGFVGRPAVDTLRCASGSETTLDQKGSSTSVVWNGSGYGVVWTKDIGGPASNNSDLFFTRVDASGAKIGVTTTVTTSTTTSSYSPKLVWNGSEYGLAWFETGETLGFARLSSEGVVLSRTAVTSTSDRPTQELSLVADASGYALAWEQYTTTKTELYFARLDRAGALRSAPQAVTNTPDYSGQPTLVWTGTEYGLAWTELTSPKYRVYFQRRSATGATVGSIVAITDGTNYAANPALVWSGTEYGVVWSDARNTSRELYFTRLSSSGAKLGADVRVTNVSGSRFSPLMTWSSNEYGIAWYDQRAGNSNLEVYFARLDAQGTKIGSEARITNGASASTVSSLVPTAQGYAMGRDLEVPGTAGTSTPTLVTVACPSR